MSGNLIQLEKALRKKNLMKKTHQLVLQSQSHLLLYN